MGSSVDIKYVCLTDGIADLVLTIYMPNFKPVDLAWLKACETPRLHQSETLTAPQALNSSLCILGFCLCGLVLFSLRGKSASGMWLEVSQKASNVELASKV